MPREIQIYNGETAQPVASVANSSLTETSIPNLNWAAWGDSLILTEQTLPPLQLKWNGGTSFSLSTISFAEIPTYEFTPNDVSPAATLTVSAKTGFVTATTNGDAFQTSDAGKYIQILPLGRLRTSTRWGHVGALPHACCATLPLRRRLMQSYWGAYCEAVAPWAQPIFPWPVEARRRILLPAQQHRHLRVPLLHGTGQLRGT
jgi:hypothetical protein